MRQADRWRHTAAAYMQVFVISLYKWLLRHLFCRRCGLTLPAIFFIVRTEWGEVAQSVSVFPVKQIFRRVFMFGGIHDLNIDSKGRLAVPAKFRDLLLRKYTPALVATLESRERLLLYPESVWEQEAQRLMAANVAGNAKLSAWRDLLLNNAEVMEMDAAGRILLPAGLRRKVMLDKEVSLTGRVNRLELWDREKFHAKDDAALDIDPEELDFELGQIGFQL